MKREFTQKKLKAICFNCEHKFNISPKQFLFSYRIYCPSCRKYFDNPHAPRFFDPSRSVKTQKPIIMLRQYHNEY